MPHSTTINEKVTMNEQSLAFSSQRVGEPEARYGQRREPIITCASPEKPLHLLSPLPTPGDGHAHSSASTNVEVETTRQLRIHRNPHTKINLLSSLQITHELHPDVKTQHFACFFLVYIDLGGQEAAQIQAWYINRSCMHPKSSSQPKKETTRRIPRSFYKSMESLNKGDSDGYMMALDLFRADGTLFPVHTHYGPWGIELNKDAILVLGLVLVYKDFRKRGFGSMLIEELVRKVQARRGGVKYVLVKPGPVPAEVEPRDGDQRGDADKRALANATAFYRSRGFRRVGRSEWLAWSVEEDHPSRKVSIEDDEDVDERFQGL